MTKHAQSNDYYLPAPPLQTTFAATDDPALDTPLPPAQYMQNPVRTGVLLGVLGAGAGGTYAGLHNMLSKQPVAVARPMLLGAAIGSALGGLLYAKDKQRRNMRQPRDWREINQRVYRRMYGMPLYKSGASRYLGLRLLTGPMQKNAQWYNPLTYTSAIGRGLGYAAEGVVRGTKEMAQARAAGSDVGPGSYTYSNMLGSGPAVSSFGQPGANEGFLGRVQDATQRPMRQLGRMIYDWGQKTPSGRSGLPGAIAGYNIAKEVGPYFIPGVGAYYNAPETGHTLGSGAYNLAHGDKAVGAAQFAGGMGEVGLRAAALLPGGGLLQLARAGKLAPMLNWANQVRKVKALGWVSPTVNKAKTVISRLQGVAPANAGRLQKALVATEEMLPLTATIAGSVAADAAQKTPNERDPRLVPVPGKPGSFSPFQPEQAKEISTLMQEGAFRNPQYVENMKYYREHPAEAAEIIKLLNGAQ